MTQTPHYSFRSWWIWSWAALFYAFEFYLRIFPNAMIPELKSHFQLNAMQVGHLSAYYYYAYALMQIPVGFLLDEYGTQRWLWLAALMVSIGALLFSQTASYPVALGARIIIGAGSAFAFIGTLRLVSAWFPKSFFPLLVGLTNTMGILGALCGSGLLGYWLVYEKWSTILLVSGGMGLILTLSILFFVADAPKTIICRRAFDIQKLLELLKLLLKQRILIYYSLLAGLMITPITSFTELWGVSFLQLDLNISRAQAAFLSSMTFIGIAFGGPFWGWLYKKTSRIHRWLFLGNLTSLLALMALLYLPTRSIHLTEIYLFLMGVGTSSMLLCFSINYNLIYPTGAHSLVIALTNMLIMLLGTLFQPLIGYCLDLLHHGRLNSIGDFQKSLSLIVICQCVVLIMVFIGTKTSFLKQNQLDPA